MRCTIVSALLCVFAIVALPRGHGQELSESDPTNVKKPPSIDELLLFFPSKFPNGDWNPKDLKFQDVFFTSEDKTKLHGWYCPADDPRAVVLIAHGNAGHVASRAAWLRYLQTKANVSVFMFDYRGYGRSEGIPTVAGAIQDATSARAKLCELATVTDSEMLLIGESLGGAVVFTNGAWFKERIYEDKCDISPDGKLFLYFVLQGSRAGTEFTHAWTAVSRTPWKYAHNAAEVTPAAGWDRLRQLLHWLVPPILACKSIPGVMMNIAFHFLLVGFAFLQSKPGASLKLSFMDHSGQPVQVTIDEQNSEPTAGDPYVPHLRESSIDGKIDVVVDDKNTEQCCFVYAKGFAIECAASWRYCRSIAEHSNFLGG